MKKVIAIHPDKYTTDKGLQSFSDTWVDYLNSSSRYEVRIVDVHSQSFFDDISDVDAFMWRGFSPMHFEYTKRLVPSIESSLKIPVFPSSLLALLTHDKVMQSILLKTHDVPAPKTDVIMKKSLAEERCARMNYPKVVKLAKGARSDGVGVVRTKKEAERYIQRMFGSGITSFRELEKKGVRRKISDLKRLLPGGKGRGAESGYAYFQEYLSRNDFDTRVTVIGQYAMAFRRFNRESDFRASGSGLIDWDPSAVEFDAVELAFRVSRQLNLPFVAVDVLRRDGEPCVCELNFSYAEWAVDRCPGYWRVEDGEPIEQARWVDRSPACAAMTLEEFLRINAL